MNTRFSIVTVTYNSSKTVEQTIQSVLSQTYSNFEYIIVDGASKDGTVDIIKRYAALDSRVRYISELDNGIYDAMNKGIRMASGDAIALLNSDDYYEPDALENIAKYIPEGNFYVVYGMVRMLKNDKVEMVLLNSHDFLSERMIMHPACFVSKEVYDQYQYDTSYRSAADYDLFVRLSQDERIEFIPAYKVITNFRMGGMSSSVIGIMETNEIRYKYGFITKRQRDIGNMGVKIKKLMMK